MADNTAPTNPIGSPSLRYPKNIRPLAIVDMMIPNAVDAADMIVERMWLKIVAPYNSIPNIKHLRLENIHGTAKRNAETGHPNEKPILNKMENKTNKAPALARVRFNASDGSALMSFRMACIRKMQSTGNAHA
ncbi:hypothetical protein DES53_104331 [Roseimicrobium gellanilyticum]|uniref:Uncharacterized protein n=1 Tax=Roseimicrobium gellanilyticum TaxID=748857 RepID=A0A366HPX0_9BACT|nr:hypothetical protein DES53_104331 [Roseimicrobium gellanilyticum]